MVLNGQEINRLAIYFFYDVEGIVDGYIPYLLRDLKNNVSRLLIVCNGSLTDVGKAELEKITPDILVRENQGFDVWAYKAGLEHYGWEGLKDLDELVLLNFTLMGPLTPFAAMFEEMDQRDVDFWGITTHAKVGFDPFGKSKYGYIPLHLQSHFIAVRKKMLQSPEFKEYWDERPMVNTYEEAVCWHELIFTKDFADKGFTWQAYVDTAGMEGYAANPITLAPVELIKNKKCPVFKKRSFYHNYQEFLSLSVGNASLDLFEYIRDHTNYDIDMIWETLLRTQHLADIKNCLHLNYILPSEPLGSGSTFTRKIALVMQLSDILSIDFYFQYARSIPRNADVYILTDTQEKKNRILSVFEALGVHRLVVQAANDLQQNSIPLTHWGNELLAYDYVCFVHDKKSFQADWGIQADSLLYQCYENLLKSPALVENILHLFEKNPRLGLLMPPPAGFDDHYSTYGFSWGNNFPAVEQLADELGLRVPLSQAKEPVAPLENMFWFRPAALKKLFECKHSKSGKETFSSVFQYIYPFVAQQAGYYSAWVLADSFARIDVTNKSFMLAEINKRASPIYGRNSHYGLVITMQSTLADGSAGRNTDRALKALLLQRLKRASPAGVWNFLRKLYYLSRQKATAR